MQRGFTPILIVVLVAVALVGGYFLYTSLRANPAKPESVAISTAPVSVSTPTTKPESTFSAETTNWKTYTDASAKYSFRYPNKWPLSKIPISKGCDTCLESVSFSEHYNYNSEDTTLAVILVFKDGWVKNVKTLDDYIKFIKAEPTNVEIKETKVGGEKAVSYKLSGGVQPLPVIEYVTTRNRIWYVIRLVDSIETNKNNVQNTKIFDQILSTFKFTP